MTDVWTGAKDDRAAPHPRRGTWVVYYLLDDDDAVQYVGLSKSWWTRIHGHRPKPWWSRWVAQECMDGPDAAAFEAAEIRRCDPPHNVAGRVA